MKQRLLSAGVAIALLITIISFYNTIILNIALSIISMIMIYEFFHSTKFLKNKSIQAVCLVFSGIIPFFSQERMLAILPYACFFFIVILFMLLLKNRVTIKIEQIGLCVLICIIIPFTLSIGVYLRDIHGDVLGFLYTLLALGGAWLTDTGAYFSGKFFGKNKMCPSISPNKTVEGAVGGIIFNTILFLLIGVFYQVMAPYFGVTITVNYLLLLVFAPIISVFGILGDLLASVIKRQYGIKDFGNIMPGHGGALDRFDSVLLIAPLMYLICNLATLFTVVEPIL